MPILNTLSHLVNHPLTRYQKLSTLSRFLRWQIASRLVPYPVIYPFVEDSVLIQKRGRTGSTGNIYLGLHEFKDMAFLLHLLRPEDLFYDIGANVGSYSVLAGKVAKAQVVAIEPIPSTYAILLQNQVANQLAEQMQCLNIGLGSTTRNINFTASEDTTNHAIANNESVENMVTVAVKRLDEIVTGPPTLLKIDVEGFEKEVLEGGMRTLKHPNLNAIIIELNGSGQRYGYQDSEIHDLLLNLNFKPYDYQPFNRVLKQIESYGPHNTIYIKDISWVRSRLKSARKFQVLNKSI